jgi:hypothetical protein
VKVEISFNDHMPRWFNKKSLVGLLVATMVIVAAACNSNSSAENDVQRQVNTQQEIYNKAQPIPQYNYSNERAELIAIYNARTVGNVNTWTVWYSNNGIPLGMCASKGFPIPYTVELTNPQQVTRQYINSSAVDGVISQADPNGLYPNGDTQATWILCLNSDGTSSPVYMEPLAVAFTYPVKIENGQVVPVGSTDGSVKIQTKTGTATNPEPTPKK